MKEIRSLALAGLFVLSAAHCGAATLTEDFSTDPLQNGWQIFGNTNLFRWNSTNQNLEVTWDSSQPNSYFYHPLGTTLTRAGSFAVDFDIQLDSIQWAPNPELPMSVAVGLFNFNEATNALFSRPDGATPNLFEFDYYPDNGDGAFVSHGHSSLDATLADQAGGLTNFPDFYFLYDLLPMATNMAYHVTLAHSAGATDLSGTVYTNGQIYTSLPSSYAGPIADFQLDTLSLSSFKEDPGYPDMLLAHGTVDNFAVTLPPVVGNLTGAFSNGVWQARFGTYANYLYTLERSTNLASWSDVPGSVTGTGGVLILWDTNAPAGKAFYRVRATQL